MQPPAGTPAQWGTVGWPDDGGTSMDLGDATNDGANLVRVTLFAGYAPTKDLVQGQAQGKPILCRLADHVSLPVRGDLVMVVTPTPYGRIPGASVIVAKCSSNYQAQANLAGGEQVLQVPGSPAQIFVRQNGTILLKTADAKGNVTFIKLAPNELRIVAPGFMVVMDQTGIRLRHWMGAQLRIGGATGMPAPLSQLDTYIRMSAGTIKNDAPLVMLGPDKNGTANYLPVPYGPDPSPAPFYSALMTALQAYQQGVVTLLNGASPSSGLQAGLPAFVALSSTLTTAITAAVAQYLLSTGVKISAP